MNGYYRLMKPTTGIVADAGSPTAVSIPAGSTISLLDVSSPDDRFTEVLWGEERLRLFSADFHAAAQPIPVRRFNAAGKEIPRR